MAVKRVAILGSTGTIGINALKVIDHFPKRFKVVALTAYNNVTLLEKQIKKYSPRYVAINGENARHFKNRAKRSIKIFDAKSEITQIASCKDIDIVVIGIRGSGALLPFLAAVKSGKTIAPANKEALVMAGDMIMREAKRHNATIIPVDSEQSAIFQCLQGGRRSELKKIYLTASGGPLWHVPKSRFDKMSVRQILKHPRWKMGKKITVDSATLMNKGLEIIEAKWLFDVNVDCIEVLIHPEVIIHSMVEFNDGSILAQLGITDMRLPIQYALTFPERLKTHLKQINFLKLKQLTFKKPDFHKFPSLELCFYAGRGGGTLPCVLNAANEEAVEAFLNGRLLFSKIFRTVERVILRHKNIHNPRLNDIWQTDGWAREEARRIMSR